MVAAVRGAETAGGETHDKLIAKKTKNSELIFWPINLNLIQLI